MTKSKYKHKWPWERSPNYNYKLSRMYEDATVERRKRMTDEEVYRDLLEELMEAAQLRTALYEVEMAKAFPEIPKLTRLWCEQWEDLELAAMATPPAYAGPFEDEMKICDVAIDALTDPFLKKLGGPR